MPQAIRAVVVDSTAPGKLALKPVELRDPDRDEVGVRVTAISLNRGETRRALQVAEPGWRPGWDFAGVVETAAADYVALGHWDRAAQVGDGAVPAYYSGSPEYVHTVNLVRLTAVGEVIVTREPVLRDRG